MRRLAPIGLATNIGWSANIRAVRHVIEMRTAPGAEEEIRLLFAKVGALCVERFPHLFGDYRVEEGRRLPLVPHRASQSLGRQGRGPLDLTPGSFPGGKGSLDSRLRGNDGRETGASLGEEVGVV